MYVSNKWIRISLENPFKTWWRAKKYFKIPKTSIQFFKKEVPVPYPWLNLGKILDIRVNDLMWKDKWNSPRHEEDPYVLVCIFNRFGFLIKPQIYTLNEYGEKRYENSIYWEYLLDYLYYSKSLKISHWWTTESKVFTRVVKWGNKEDGTEDEIKPYTLPIPQHLFSLNKRGLKEFKKLYEKE